MLVSSFWSFPGHKNYGHYTEIYKKRQASLKSSPPILVEPVIFEAHNIGILNVCVANYLLYIEKITKI